MNKTKSRSPKMSQREFGKRAMDYWLPKIQQQLPPERAHDIVAINVETGEFEIGDSAMSVIESFKQRWPDQLFFLVRVDGGAVYRFRGM